eukprot:497738_1
MRHTSTATPQFSTYQAHPHRYPIQSPTLSSLSDGQSLAARSSSSLATRSSSSSMNGAHATSPNAQSIDAAPNSAAVCWGPPAAESCGCSELADDDDSKRGRNSSKSIGD